MKKFLKYLGLTLVVTIIVIVCYVKFALPNVGDAPDIKVDASPEKIERGRYLANHVSVCVDCHSTRDWNRFSGPIVEGTEGKGSEVFDQKFGFPGRYTSKNITPAGIGNWTDGELFRTITTGVNKEGKALFPVMPSHYYGQMDEEDIKCIIAYIRTLKPIENKPEESVSDFPMNLIINTIPHKANPQKLPPVTDVVNYGKYIANAASCIECHTQFDKGKLVAGTEYGGGREFPFPNGAIIRSSNITTDLETGIGTWTKEQFVSIFRARSDSATLAKKLNPDDFNSIMPWTMYGKMTTQDLEALFAYLRTIKPIKNEVIKFSPKK
jgi:mono/diheme cytochrome c family protein